MAEPFLKLLGKLLLKLIGKLGRKLLGMLPGRLVGKLLPGLIRRRVVTQVSAPEPETMNHEPIPS